MQQKTVAVTMILFYHILLSRYTTYARAVRTDVRCKVYSTACASLQDEWDRSVNSFPSFVVSLKLQASEAKWDVMDPYGILFFVGTNILTHYHSISEIDVETAPVTRANNRTIQNSRAMFQCIKLSIKGSVRDMIFAQVNNLSENADGPSLFKMLTTFTSIASVQLSLMSLNSILEFNPLNLKFNIPRINTKLSHLFVLATTRTRTLDHNEHNLNAYCILLQPEIWAQWVWNKEDSFKDGIITNCKDFMNSAVIKYSKICDSADGFKGSINIRWLYLQLRRRTLPNASETLLTMILIMTKAIRSSVK